MANDYGNSTGYTVQMGGPYGSVGSSGKITQITLPAANWKNAVSPYFQTVSVSGLSTSSLVEIQATKEQIQQLCESGTAIHIENDRGVSKAWAIGTKPTADLVFQVTLEEVMST